MNGLQEDRHERELDIARILRARGMDFATIREITGVRYKDLGGKK